MWLHGMVPSSACASAMPTSHDPKPTAPFNCSNHEVIKYHTLYNKRSAAGCEKDGGVSEGCVKTRPPTDDDDARAAEQYQRSIQAR